MTGADRAAYITAQYDLHGCVHGPEGDASCSRKTHGRPPPPEADVPAQLVEAPAPTMLKLDLGCGQSPRDGYEGVDLYGESAKHRVDLFKFPWPFENASVDAIHCSHFLEHVPAREIEERDLIGGIGTAGSTDPSSPMYTGGKMADPSFLGQDMLFAFMDECWRILKPDCWMEIVVPSGRSDRAFQDPTHRRFFVPTTFAYFNAEWRKVNKLDHYRVRCNFGSEIGHTLPAEETLRSNEAQAMRFMHYWNVTVDWVAKLKKLPALP